MNLARNCAHFIKCYEQEVFKEKEQVEAIATAWSWSELKQKAELKLHSINIDWENEKIFYLRPTRRRGALQKLKTSINEFCQLKQNEMNWEADFLLFLEDILNSMERDVTIAEMIYSLQLNYYDLDDANKSLLTTSSDNPIAIRVYSTQLNDYSHSTIVGEYHSALVFLETNKSHYQEMMKKKESLFEHMEDRKLLKYQERPLHGTHASIYIFHSPSNSISLEDLMKEYFEKDKYLPKEKILNIVKQILLSIKELHIKDIVHGSINPSNIFIDSNNHTRLGNIATVSQLPAGCSLMSVTSTSTSNLFTAPEIQNSGLIGISSDIWSLGCILYKMITRQYFIPTKDLDLSQYESIYGEEFIQSCLEILLNILGPSKRLTAGELLAKDIFRNFEVCNAPEIGENYRGRLDNLAPAAVTTYILHGGFGQVFFVDDHVVKRPWNTSEAREELENEKEIAFYKEATLGKPAAIVQLHTIDSRISSSLKMELCKKGNLHSIIQSRNGKPFAIYEAVQYFLQLSNALNHLQSIHLIHRDVKPQNIVITATNVAKLTDFGSGVILPPGKKCIGPAGTPEYNAPEMLKGELYDHSIDVWSLGCVFYNVLTLQHPFPMRDNWDKMKAHIEKGKYEIPPLKSLMDEITVLLKATLCVNPKERKSIAWVVENVGEMVITNHSKTFVSKTSATLEKLSQIEPIRESPLFQEAENVHANTSGFMPQLFDLMKKAQQMEQEMPTDQNESSNTQTQHWLELATNTIKTWLPKLGVEISTGSSDQGNQLSTEQEFFKLLENMIHAIRVNGDEVQEFFREAALERNDQPCHSGATVHQASPLNWVNAYLKESAQFSSEYLSFLSADTQNDANQSRVSGSDISSNDFRKSLMEVMNKTVSNMQTWQDIPLD